jgi:hypothetical protein
VGAILAEHLAPARRVGSAPLPRLNSFIRCSATRSASARVPAAAILELASALSKARAPVCISGLAAGGAPCPLNCCARSRGIEEFCAMPGSCTR